VPSNPKFREGNPRVIMDDSTYLNEKGFDFIRLKIDFGVNWGKNILDNCSFFD